MSSNMGGKTNTLAWIGHGTTGQGGGGSAIATICIACGKNNRGQSSPSCSRIRHVIYSQILHKALANVSKCPESDLTKYCMSVDGIVTEALCRHEDPEIELLREIQADAVRKAANNIPLSKVGNDNLSITSILKYADKLQAGML